MLVPPHIRLDASTEEGLVKFNFQNLTCSIDGATPEVYAIYRRGGHFENVMADIEKINFYKAKYQSSRPNLVWQFVAFGHNEHEIEDARRMAQKLNMG